jgi:hypothetical protein
MTHQETIALITQLIAEKGLSPYSVMLAGMQADKDTAWATSSMDRGNALDTINREREDEGMEPLDSIPDEDWEDFKNYFDGNSLVSGDDDDCDEVVKEALSHLIEE